MSSQALLHFKNIKKSFSGNVVLDGVNFEIYPGQVVALAGENGAGKSTLMNILFGMSVIHDTGGYEGEIIFEGKNVQIQSPQEAMALGIGMVHQEFMLLPGFTVARNIKLNRENLVPSVVSRIAGKNYELLDQGAIIGDAKKALKRLGMEINPQTTVDKLPVGHMQFVEIAREIDKKNLKLLVLDEPTAVLTESEAERFLECIRKVADEGIAVTFISHRLDEVMELADSVVILRDGQMVFSEKTANTNKHEIAELMVGRKLEAESLINVNRNLPEDYILEVSHFKVNMPGEKSKDVSFRVKRGEIFGIGGLAGHGKTSISNGIFGMYPATGTVTYEGKQLQYGRVGEALKKGMAFVSEDRKGVGLLLEEPISLNMVYTDMRVNRHFLKKYVFFSQFDSQSSGQIVDEMIRELDIRCTGPEQPVGRLSGGNQQKVCVARALITKPKILFVSEPTRGIDIGAKQILLNYLVKINKELGITIVMTSSELNELRSVCDRIAIIGQGIVQGILKPDSPNVDFALLMSGEGKENSNDRNKE